MLTTTYGAATMGANVVGAGVGVYEGFDGRGVGVADGVGMPVTVTARIL